MVLDANLIYSMKIHHFFVYLGDHQIIVYNELEKSLINT